MSIGDVQVAGGVHGDPIGNVQLGADGRAIVPAVALRPAPRHGSDHPIGNLADPEVISIGDVEVAGGVHGDAFGSVQLSAGSRTAIAAVASQEDTGPSRPDPHPGHGGDHPIGYLADAVVQGVGDIEVASSVHGDALGIEQLSAGSRAVVAVDAERTTGVRPRPRDGGDRVGLAKRGPGHDQAEKNGT